MVDLYRQMIAVVQTMVRIDWMIVLPPWKHVLIQALCRPLYLCWLLFSLLILLILFLLLLPFCLLFFESSALEPQMTFAREAMLLAPVTDFLLFSIRIHF